jgi:hypothetical protein
MKKGFVLVSIAVAAAIGCTQQPERATEAALPALPHDTHSHAQTENLDLTGRDPDAGLTDIAYEKGAAFLQTVESVVGRDRLDKFLREYFDHFAFQPMSSERMVAYMRALPDAIPPGRMAELDKAFKFSSSGNSEILFQWLRMSVRNRYEAAFPALERFLTTQGRRKFIAPLYAELAKTDWGKKMAMDIYRRARPTYHSVATSTIDKTLGWGK